MAIHDDYIGDLEKPRAGKGFTDEELRNLFNDTVEKLEDEGDYDVLKWHVEGHDAIDSDMFSKVVHKVLKRNKITLDNLNDYQVFHLKAILDNKKFRRASDKPTKMKVRHVYTEGFWKEKSN